MSKLRVDELQSLETGKVVEVDHLDTNLRAELEDPTMGAAIISYRATNVLEALDARIQTIATVDDLRQTEPLHIGQVVYVREFYLGHGYGGGLYEAVDSSYSGSDSEETLGGSRWKLIVENNVFPIDRLGASKTDSSAVLDAFLRAIECVREAGSGTVQCPPGEWEMLGTFLEVNTSNITFEFVKGCHIKMHTLLLGWYPIAVGVGYENVSFIGEGVVESMPGTMWHNDFAYVNNIQIRDLTFINSVRAGHFLDLNGCNNVVIDGITVLGSGIEWPQDPRLFTEFIQIATATMSALGWSEMREKYADMRNNAPTNNVRLSNSVFAPYTDDEGITSYPPRPIGNHDTGADLRTGVGVIIENCKFTDIIRSNRIDRSAWIELPSGIDVRVSGNTFTCTGAGIPAEQPRLMFLDLHGGEPLDNVIVDSNYFHVTSDIGIYLIGILVRSCSAVKITNNSFHCATDNSDIVSLGTSAKLADVSGNTVSSVGRRFLYSAAESTHEIIACNNSLEFTTPVESSYRAVIHTVGGHIMATGNIIKHPAWGGTIAGTYATGVLANNIFIGSNPGLTLGSGALTGNVFHTTTAPVVNLGGVVQSSQGWDFVHIPA